MNILWTETLWVNGIRLAAATLFWFVVMLFVGEDVTTAFGLPVMYLIVAPIALVLNKISVFFGGFFSLMALITILPGDPLVFLLKLVAPQAVPMAVYNPINMAFFLYVKAA